MLSVGAHNSTKKMVKITIYMAIYRVLVDSIYNYIVIYSSADLVSLNKAWLNTDFSNGYLTGGYVD